jgi:hypothetical protein
MQLHRRAEASDAATLVETFVDVGPLFTLLSSRDHQVLYGRRGTGKTHALTFLRAHVNERGDFASMIDLRTIGSTGGLYGDESLPLTERGTRLLADVLGQLHDDLTDFVLERAEGIDLTTAMGLLDRLGSAITDVRVVGQHEQESMEATTHAERTTAGLNADVAGDGPAFGVRLGNESADTQSGSVRARVSGVAQHRVHFGEVSRVLGRLVGALPVQRIWLLLDEWANVPLDLQPLLADLLRRAVFPVQGLVVKIAAIEQRSQFSADTGRGDYIGIELGADAAADLDLDDFMVFANDPEAAKRFFRELLFKHVRSQIVEETGEAGPSTADEFQRAAFTQRNAIDEFVQAAEGVPRDALNIVRIAAMRAGDGPIGVEQVRTAARRWYLTDKERAVGASQEAAALLHWIVDTVIGERRARAFLLGQHERNARLVVDLYDARVLHVIKRGVSSRDEPGVRYDVYQLDFGCYVELIATTRAPQGLFQAATELEDGAWVAVPAEDYRSIRRAILDLNEFQARPLPLGGF